MKVILILLLITFQLHAKSDTLIYNTGDTAKIDKGMYLFESAVKSKFKDSVLFEYQTKFLDIADFLEAYVRNLRMPLNDGVLHLSEQIAFTGPVYQTDLGIQAGRVLYGDSNNRGKTSEYFYYNDTLATLFVPNIVIGDGFTLEEFITESAFRKVNKDYALEDKVETIFVDTSLGDINISLRKPKKTGKTIFIKKTKGKNKLKADDFKIKDDLKLLWDGEKWFKL